MQNCRLKLFFLFFLFTGLMVVKQTVFAEDKCKNISDQDDQAACYEKKAAETEQKLSETRQNINSVMGSITQLSGQLSVTQEQLSEVQTQVDLIKKELAIVQTNLADRNAKLSDKIFFRDALIRNYAKKAPRTDLELFISDGFKMSALMGAYNKSINEELLKIIGALNIEIKDFEKNRDEEEIIKKDLEEAQTKLLALKNDLANKKNTAQSQYNNLEEKASEYEETLEKLQSKILALKASDENGSVGDYESPKVTTPNPPFSGTAFAVFSYGAYTHYNGMSQYGAKGRADAGKNYKDILKFYYKVETTKKSDFPSKINVQGHGNLDFQYYLYGIAEMPTNWPIEALKAQAIAARTYAYKSNKPICTTQSCQVFLKSKADEVKAGKYPNWKKAVDETSKEILNNSATSQYSSTTGGYINNIGWDVKGDWPGDAYEKKAGSPWFYKAWYTKSYNDSSSCGHPHPWLTSSEMADILNSHVVWSKGSSKDKSHITPTTKSCWGGDPYSLDKMRETADKYGDSYSKVTGVNATISNGGYTSQVTFTTDNGTVTITGDNFKTVFNLRAPGYLSAKSRLFDLEKRN